MSATPAVLVKRARPQVVGDDPRRFWHLTLTLAATEFKVRYFGSVLGYLWTLVRPLMLFSVLYFVFTEVAGVNSGVRFYGIYLLSSIVLWSFFAEVTSGSVTCLVNREELLRKMRFPRLVVPLSVTLTALFNLGINIVVVMVFALASGVTPRLSWLALPALILLLTVFAAGIGMLLAPLYVRYRDVQPMWDVALQVGFYASPILYVAAKLPDSVERIFLASPIAAILTEMRYVFLDPSAPSLAAAMGATWRVLIPLAVTFGALALGAWYFSRQAPHVAEDL